jgi:P-type E1-E2 ATPase
VSESSYLRLLQLLTRNSSRFVVIVSCIAILFALVFFAVGITTVYAGKAAQTVTFAVSILVAFVPEGLPSVVTLLLSIAAKRMAKQNVLVKDLQGVETLGTSKIYAVSFFRTERSYRLSNSFFAPCIFPLF